MILAHHTPPTTPAEAVAIVLSFAALAGVAIIIRKLNRMEPRICRKLDHIMALVQIDQTVLDSFGTELGNIADAVQAIVDAPDNPLADADVTGITEPISRLQAALAKPEEPVVE